MPGLKINQNKSLYLAGSLLFAASGFFILSFLQPFTIDNSYADSDNTSIDVSASLEPTLSISTDVDTVNLTVNPSDYESLVTGDVNVNVSTNNPTGYTLSIASSSSETALINKNNSNITIPTLSSETTATAWEENSSLNNKWGFTHNNTDLLATGTYLPMVAANEDNETTIKTTDGANNSSSTKLTFATKVDSSQASGEYYNTIIVSAVANPLVDYMQDFTAEKCSKLSTWESTDDDLILVDKRDKNEYTVRKLADGNCWMTNDLRLENYTLTPADSNVQNSVSIPAATSEVSTEEYAWGPEQWIVKNNNNYYYNISAAMALNGTSDNLTYAAAGESSACPKNWRLPSVDEWRQLGSSYGDLSSREAVTTESGFAPNFESAGLYSVLSSPQQVSSAGVSSRWWSMPGATSGEGDSTKFGSLIMSFFSIGRTGMNSVVLVTGNHYGQFDGLHYWSALGLSVRCLIPPASS